MSLSYVSYQVMDEPEPGFRERLVEAIQKHAFRDIDVEGGKDRSIGWCRTGDVFSTELTWDVLFLDPHVTVSLREDSLKVPPNAFRTHLQRREEEFLRQSGRDKLSRGERANIKADVLLQLRRRAIPEIKSYAVEWNTVEGTMRLHTTNKRIREVFEDLVRETWGLRILPRAPYTAAVDTADPTMGGTIVDLEPANFVNDLGVA